MTAPAMPCFVRLVPFDSRSPGRVLHRKAGSTVRLKQPHVYVELRDERDFNAFAAELEEPEAVALWDAFADAGPLVQEARFSQQFGRLPRKLRYMTVVCCEGHEDMPPDFRPVI